MNTARLALPIAISFALSAAGCIERLPPRPPPEVPPYPQERFDAPVNAWHWYERAGDLLAREGESVQFPSGALNDPWWAPRAAEYVKQRQAALEALDRAIAARYCVVPEYDFDAPMPMMARMRELARLRVLQGRVLAHQGDPGGAVGAWLDTVEMGNDIMQEGVLVARLVGMAIDSIGLRPIIAFVQRSEGTARDYEQIIKRLNGLEVNRFPYIDTLGREYASCRPQWENLAADRAALAELLPFPVVNVEEWDTEHLGEIVRYLGLLAQSDVLLSNYDTYFSMAIEDARHPYPDRDPTFAQEVANDPISGPLLPPFSKLRSREISDVANFRAVILMAALQLYRLDHGALPPTLEALRPEYLPDLPLDPFSAQPYRCLRLPGDVFVVYSVGPDGDDDRAQVEYDRPRGAESDGDIIFREGAGEP